MRILRLNLIKRLCIPALLAVFLFPATAKAQPGFAWLYTLEDFLGDNKPALLMYSQDSKKLQLYSVEKGELKEQASSDALGRVWQACAYRHNGKVGVLAAYGYGHGDINAPLRVVLYDKDLKNPKIVFTGETSRSQTTHLEQVGDEVLLTYFDSKYYTRTGFLAPSQADTWQFREIFRTRLGMHIAYDGKTFVVGRPYRDEEENSGELRRYLGDSWHELPVSRGVSSIAFVQADADPQIELLVGDGWHKDYKKQAVPRLTLLDCQADGKTCSLKQIFVATPQIRVSKIQTVTLGKKQLVLAGGELSFDAYIPEKEFRRTRVYEKKQPNNPMAAFDFALAGLEAGKAMVAVYDGGELSVKAVEF